MSQTIPQITTGPLPGSRKIHLPGSLHAIRVPMREIAVSNEPPLVVYDSSGPYTDAAMRTDIARGLPDLRGDWQL
ncbi:phosphomethylpyrimidine synthase ThiC, partial [Paracoccus sp. PXZ]